MALRFAPQALEGGDEFEMQEVEEEYELDISALTNSREKD